MRDLSERVIVVTGASSGIGRVTSERLAGEGATVVGVARGEGALRRLADDLADAPGHVEVRAADVTDAQALERIAADVVATFGRLDGWVNAAAVASYGGVEDVPLEEFERVLAVNVMGVVHGVRAALPHLRARGEGVIVNVSSVLGRVATPYLGSYVASKFAVRGLSQSLRMELRDEPGIAVSTVLPSSVDTAFFQHAAVHTPRRPEAPSGAVDAERVARAIVATLRHPRREVVVGVVPRALLIGHAVAPALLERFLGPFFARDLFSDDEAEVDPGTLFAPGNDPRVAGGWPALGQALGRTLSAAAGAAAEAVGTAIADARHRGG